MIDVVCDPGSRYTKLLAIRDRQFTAAGRLPAMLVPSREAEDLGLLSRRIAATLQPRLFETVRLWILGEGSVPRRLRAKPLLLGTTLARAASVFGEPLLIADCGGLRTRVFEIDSEGTLLRTVENERCSAGGGRFVETMSAALQVDLESIDSCVEGTTAQCRVSSPCLVFAESEMISQVNDGVPPEAVLAGVVSHAVEKVAVLVERTKPKGRPLLLCGGLARLEVFKDRLARTLGRTRVLVPPGDPMFMSCIAGIALLCETKVTDWPSLTIIPWTRP